MMYTDPSSNSMMGTFRGVFPGHAAAGPPMVGYPQAQYFGSAGPDKPPSAMAFHGKKKTQTVDSLTRSRSSGRNGIYLLLYLVQSSYWLVNYSRPIALV